MNIKYILIDKFWIERFADKKLDALKNDPEKYKANFLHEDTICIKFKETIYYATIPIGMGFVFNKIEYNALAKKYKEDCVYELCPYTIVKKAEEYGN